MDAATPELPVPAGTAQSQPQAQPQGESEEHRDIVVIGASSGGLAPLRELAGALPSDYAGALFVVVHLASNVPSELAAILARAGPLPAIAAEDEMPIQRGTIYVAQPDCHLLVERDRMRVIRGPRENRHRPGIDPLFRSAAWAYGPRVVGIVLSGALDDGTAGLWAVKTCGGTTVVQEPGEAAHPGMPTNALMHNRIDHRLPVGEIAALLVRLAADPIESGVRPTPPEAVGREVESAKLHVNGIATTSQLGALSPFTCPTCRGALWELDEGGHLRYRCHTGHGFSLPSLLEDQSAAIEESLYAAMRALEEKSEALRRLAGRWPDRLAGVKEDYLKRAGELDRSAEVLRSLLAGMPP